jgi:hypothetical protein
MTAFWGKATCSLVKVDRSFRGAYCLHHQDETRVGFMRDRHKVKSVEFYSGPMSQILSMRNGC